MRFRGRNAFEIKVPRSGISYSTELEWRLAAQWAGYKFGEFQALDGDEQSDIIATYRANFQASAVVSYEQAQEMKRRAKKPKASSKR